MKNYFLAKFIGIYLCLCIFSIHGARLFIALDLPERVSSTIIRHQSSISKQLPTYLPAGMTFDERKAVLNILFIGEADVNYAKNALLDVFRDAENISYLTETCQQWTVAHYPSIFFNQYINLKAFPHNHTPFYLFVDRIKSSLKNQGITVTNNTYPHITLIKCKSPLTVNQENILDKFLQTKHTPKTLQNFQTPSITLYESVNEQYRPVITHNLK